MSILTYRNIIPQVAKNCFIAPGAMVIGQVDLKEGSSIWHNAVLRGDINKITIGKNSNIQDNSVVHGDSDYPVKVGDNVSVGHSAVIHGCTIGNNVLIGMNATVLNGAEIGEGSIIGANALVPQGKKIPPNSMVLGVPGKIVKTVSAEEVNNLIEHAAYYRKLWEENYIS